MVFAKERIRRGSEMNGEIEAFFPFFNDEKKKKRIICNTRLINRQEFIKLSARRGIDVLWL